MSHFSSIFVCNDDGIEADGLRVLSRFAKRQADTVNIASQPKGVMAMSRSISLKKDIAYRKNEDGALIVDGTPVDSFLCGLSYFYDNHYPDLVLAGVNHGHNLGDYVTYSGTAAIAFEATLLGIPAISLSLFQTHYETEEKGRYRWDVAEGWLPEILSFITQKGWQQGVFFNVNIPPVTRPDDIRDIRWVPLARAQQCFEVSSLEKKDEYGHFRIMPKMAPGFVDGRHDRQAIGDCFIAVTPIMVDWSHHASLI